MSEHSSNNESFQCNICYKVFSHQIGLNIHLRTHFSQQCYICGTCQMAFSQQNDLSKHLLTHNEKVSFVCCDCGKIFSHQVGLNVHLQKGCSKNDKAEDTEFSPIPDTSQSKAKSSKRINKKISKDNGTPSKIKSLESEISQTDEISVECEESSVENTSFNNDIDLKKSFFCGVCEKYILIEKKLRYHPCKSKDKEGFTCNICQETFFLKTHLYSHLHSHKRFKCMYCPREFSDSQKFVYHTKTHEKSFICKLCKKGFAVQSHLDDHIRAHISMKNYQCEVCLATFCQRSHLNRHIRTVHEKIRCETCFKYYFSKLDFQKHICVEKVVKNIEKLSEKDDEDTLEDCAVESDSESPVCSQVSVKSDLSSRVQNFLECYTSEKPVESDDDDTVAAQDGSFMCDVCFEMFHAKKSLKNHLKSHMRETSFTCVICGKKFYNLRPFRCHMQLHKKPFACEICHKRFSLKARLNLHYRSHRREEPYVCSICTETFELKECLNEHLMTHANEEIILKIHE